MLYSPDSPVITSKTSSLHGMSRELDHRLREVSAGTKDVIERCFSVYCPPDHPLLILRYFYTLPLHRYISET